MRGTHLGRHFEGNALAVHDSEFQFVSGNATHSWVNLWDIFWVVENYFGHLDNSNERQTIEFMSNKHYPRGLDGRERDQSGQIREKRGDTKVGTLRKEYGDGFAKGYRSDTKLETVRENTGKSLSELVKKK